MKKIVLILILILISQTAHAGSSLVNAWIHAMQNSGKGLNSIITPDFEYRQLNFSFGKKIEKETKGDIPFFAKESKPSTIDVEQTKGGMGGQVVTLVNTSETGLYREWQTILLIGSSGISKVTEIAIEGQMRGYPPGCPETMYKRDFILSLRGTPDGFDSPKIIKLYKYRRDTDPISYAHHSLDDKEREKCTPTPDRQTVFSEVVVLDQNDQILAANNVAIQNKEKGGIFFKEDGTNFPGRLFNIGGGKEGLLLTFTVRKNSVTSDIAKLYVRRGSGWKSIWGFDVGHGTKSGLGGRFSRNIEWSLKSQRGASGPEIIARLLKNNDQNYNCPGRTTINYTRSGSSFRPVKNGQAAACFKRNLSGSLTASPGKDEKPKEFVTEEDVDWRFQ